MSDEAHFYLNRYVNKQNSHYWAEKKPCQQRNFTVDSAVSFIENSVSWTLFFKHYLHHLKLHAMCTFQQEQNLVYTKHTMLEFFKNGQVFMPHPLCIELPKKYAIIESLLHFLCS